MAAFGKGCRSSGAGNAPEIVRRAFADAEHLIQKNGPASAVDRIHTALHAYKIWLCGNSGITVPKDASLTDVFKLRGNHPALKGDGHRAQDIGTILNSLNAFVVALNPIRNRASIAHPK
jgi:hypothetical protein